MILSSSASYALINSSCSLLAEFAEDNRRIEMGGDIDIAGLEIYCCLQLNARKKVVNNEKSD